MDGTRAAARGMRRPEHLTRRAFLVLAASGLLAAGCEQERVVYVSSRTLTPTPAPPTPTPVPAATSVPAPAQRQGALGVVPVMPLGGAAARARVAPQVQPGAQAYATRLELPERLQIPSIGLDSKVIPIATRTDDRGKLVWETAAFVVGYHRGTGLPGEKGNIVLSGHISSPREGAIFNKLPKVMVGDGIVVETSERQYLFLVKDTAVVTPDAVEVLEPTDQSTVTLITCVPDGVYSHRLIVRAEAV